MQERLRNQETMDEKFEQSIKELVKVVQTDREESAKQNAKTDANFELLKTGMEQIQRETVANREAQNQTKQAVDAMDTRITGIETDVRELKTTMEKVETQVESHGERLSTVEKWIVRISTAAAVILMIITGFKNSDVIKNLFIGGDSDVTVKESKP